MKLHPVLVLALLALPGAARAETAASDPKAVAIADQVMQSLGGKDRWNALTGIRWSFGFEQNDTVRTMRRHSWNKMTGWHRVEGKNRAGQPFVFIENMNDSTAGMAWMNGNPIVGDSLKKLMKTAKRMWTNDTYWMLMPYKLRDPGVNLGYAGEEKDSTGTTYDKLALSFDHVGQTPGDRYWVYVNRANHRIEKWDYLLESDKPPPSHATWANWEEHEGLWFPTAHRVDQGVVFTRDVEAVKEFKPTEFTAP
jgi:hypothetical protein